MANYSALENHIASEMWKIWCPVKPTPVIPNEFYVMAKFAIKTMSSEFDRMLADAIKARLERLIQQTADG